MTKQLLTPKKLTPGGTIGVIAPAGFVDANHLHRGVTFLEQRGFRVILGKNVTKRHRFFAGTDQERASDFLEMMENKEVEAIFCARGGSGSARILPYLPKRVPLFSPKIFVGGSDITTLLCHLSRLGGFVTFYGPMVAVDLGATLPESASEQLFQILSGSLVTLHSPKVQTLKPGKAHGILMGGCLSLLCTTIGTPYEIETEEALLFIEDVEEPPYRIDRMLSYLKTLGKLDPIRGLIVGQMPGCQPESLPEIILDLLDKRNIPILFGFPAGHGEPLFTLPFGIPFQMDATAKTLTMQTPAVEVQ